MPNVIILPNKKKISLVNKPYIIAEIGSNFNQNFVKAKKLILQAKYCGVDAVKFQLFKSEKLYTLIFASDNCLLIKSLALLLPKYISAGHHLLTLPNAPCFFIVIGDLLAIVNNF